ncbi:hypothetical protein EW026_g6707 [Hermanssonia centrifuga]|uniref:Uncharacterized protein n=1 Tax=Hermanssonia centrifuga TaxID=98765 RepID=A0A4S4KEI3_9APHY|nr:hypothetical protein EW026_g6707 [Hermanssonia centrifuga]
MLHYVDLIEQLGTADGFNTEWSERLHIDYAKDAYRASNKKDYIAQMTKWLSRQETVDRFAIYLEWRRNGEYLPLDLEPLTANCALMASTRDNLNVASTASTITPSTGILRRPPVRPELYHVAASHPQSLRGIPAAEIITHHNALRFLPALSSFLHAHGSLIIPQPVHRFNLYKDLTVLLPGIPQTSMKPLKNIIRASPAVPAAGRKAAEPSHFDFALVRTGETNAVTDCTPLQGIRVAHVRAIFKLPEHYRIDTLHPLVYLEWFTPFHAVDHATGLFTVSRSTRMHQVYGEVVEADRLGTLTRDTIKESLRLSYDRPLRPEELQVANIPDFSKDIEPYMIDDEDLEEHVQKQGSVAEKAMPARKLETKLKKAEVAKKTVTETVAATKKTTTAKIVSPIRKQSPKRVAHKPGGVLNLAAATRNMTTRSMQKGPVR